MKSASIGTLLSVVSIVGVGILYLKVDDLSDQVRPLTKGRAERYAVNDLPDDSIERDAPARAVSDEPPGEAADDGKFAKVQPSAREAELERRIASLEKAAKKRNHLPSFRMPKFARNVRDLAKTLKLNKTQETRIQDVVDRAKQRIEDVMKIPDDTGVSPFERRKEAREKMQESMGVGKMPDISAMIESRNATRKTIPGRNTTYAQEVDRIKKDARNEIKSNLTQEQAKEFEDTRIDPLLGESGVRSVMAFHTVDTGDGEGGQSGAIVVEGAVDITVTEGPEKDDDE